MSRMTVRVEDVLVKIGRARHGGDFLLLEHRPTGVTRLHPGPMRGVNQHDLQLRFRQEIAEELAAAGRTEHLVPDPFTPDRRRHGRNGP